ncbi:MAG TPA: hypothetical protein VGG39_29975 [Polyangiaceae bacterium]|jgi:hypothetical protein
MAIARRTRRKAARTAAAGSWLALLAATTVGDAASTVRAQVRADGLRAGAYRLVVQSYDASRGGMPRPDERPVGSMQRSVTADELRSGVSVNLLELRAQAGAATHRPMVVAWIESGPADLEFDGRAARPSPGSVYGVAHRASDDAAVEIQLNRMLAA